MSILTKKKDFANIIKKINNPKGVLVLGCHGCAKDSSTGGPKEVKEMMKKLESRKIKSYSLEDPCMEYVCWERTVEKRFSEIKEISNKIDVILLLACGTGVSCLNSVFKKHDFHIKIVSGNDTIGIGHVPLSGPEEVTCWICGDCELVKDEDGYYKCKLMVRRQH